jgi:Zn-finger nucleic acid-binding protein
MLGTPPEGHGRACPVCRKPMLAAVMDDSYRIAVCDQCKGTLMPRHAFAETIVARRRAATTRATIPSPADRRDLDRRLACPVCDSQMITDWYYGPGNIVLDSCVRCDVVWLDSGELRRVIDAPGTDRR